MRTNHTTNDERAQVFCNGRVVGGIVVNTFRKHLCGSQHFLRKPPSIAFDVSTLQDAERAGAVNVLVIDDETGTEYRASIARIWERGFDVGARAGTSKQVGLLLADFNCDDATPTPTTPKPTQPALFNLARLMR